MNKVLTDQQKEILREYGVYSGKDIDLVLDELDAKIVEIGFEKGQQSLNRVGDRLQRLYDDIFASVED